MGVLWFACREGPDWAGADGLRQDGRLRAADHPGAAQAGQAPGVVRLRAVAYKVAKSLDKSSPCSTVLVFFFSPREKILRLVYCNHEGVCLFRELAFQIGQQFEALGSAIGLSCTVVSDFVTIYYK